MAIHGKLDVIGFAYEIIDGAFSTTASPEPQKAKILRIVDGPTEIEFVFPADGPGSVWEGFQEKVAESKPLGFAVVGPEALRGLPKMNGHGG